MGNELLVVNDFVFLVRWAWKWNQCSQSHMGASGLTRASSSSLLPALRQSAGAHSFPVLGETGAHRQQGKDSGGKLGAWSVCSVIALAARELCTEVKLGGLFLHSPEFAPGT